MGQIQPADATARRKALWLVGITALFGLCAILAFGYYQSDFQAWLEQNIDYLARNPFVEFLAVLIFVSPLCVAGIYLFMLGNRTVRAQCFPPPHYVSRDTPVLEGSQGIRRGRIIQTLSIFILLAAGAIPFIFLSIFRAFGNTA